MRRLLVLALLVAAGCGVRPSGVIPGLAAPAGPAQGPVPTLYFVSGQQVQPVYQVAPSAAGVDVVGLLAAGPDSADRERGLTTQVPADAAPATVTRSGGGLDVRLPDHVAELSPLAVDQIVCTLLAQYPGAAWASVHGGTHPADRRTCPAAW